MPVKATYLMLAAGGIIFAWSGFKGKSVSSVLRNVVSGQNPQSAQTTAAIYSSGGANVPAGSASYDSKSKLQKLWTSNGGPKNTAAFAAAIAIAESGGSATVTSPNPDGGTNVGIWQLDTRGVGAGYSVSQLQNANLNARITIAATNGGRDWSNWGDPVAEQVGYHYTPGSAVP